MRKVGYFIGTLAMVACGASTPSGSDSSDEGVRENFAGGTQPLTLLPAPAGLCEGDGTQKECDDPEGCTDEGSEFDDGASGGSSGGGGSGGSYASSGTGGSSPIAGGYGGSSTGGSTTGGFGGTTTGGFGGTTGGTGASTSGGASGAAGAGISGNPDPIGTGGTGEAGAGGEAGAEAPISGGGTNASEQGGAGGVSEPDGPAGASNASRGGAGGDNADTARPGGASSGADSSDPARHQAPDPSPPDDAVASQPSESGSPGEGAQLGLQNDPGACSALDDATPYTLYQSADDSNSTASATIVRRMIRGGWGLIPPTLVRPYEFLNYYDFSFEPAEPGEVRIVAQLSSCPVDGELAFQVALQSESRDPSDRAPLNITLVLDTSGSMSGTPIELERAALLALTGELRAGDIVSMVTWSTIQQDILTGHRITGPDDPVVVQAANALSANGGTDLHAGLTRGYELAETYYADDRINRVLLISDGQANVGITDEQLIAEKADDEEGRDGIYLAGVGVGDGVNDTLMDAVTDAGRGAYVYLDSPEEAQRMLGDRFLQVMDLAARAVRLEVTLPYYMEVVRFYGEEISVDPTQVRPQHLGPNDAMVFFQILTACDPALLHGDDRIRLRATWETPFTREPRSAETDTTLNGLTGDDDALAKAAAIAAYAEALIQVGSTTNRVTQLAILEDALGVVHSAPAADSDPDLIEVSELLQQYAQFLD